METTEEREHGILHDILTQEELLSIQNPSLNKLKSYFTEKFEEFLTAKAVFETSRQNLEKNLDTVQKEHEDQKLDLEECKGKLNLADQYVNELKTSVEEAKAEIHKLQESVKRLEKENFELRKQRDLACDERDGLQLQVERRDSDLERLRIEVNSLGSQLQAAVTAKCQALSQMEEIRSLEMTLDFKEKRLEQERTLLSQQMAGLEEELSKRTSELQTTRSEASSRSLLIDTRLSQREEELSLAIKTTNQLREAQSTLQGRCDELAQKLEDQRNHELSMHASYREEVAAQTRLTELYKSMADDTNAKAEEYTNAVKELQELIENATEQYGTLESKHNQLMQEREEENTEKDQKINELKTELAHANELLSSLRQERLDQAVEQLAPTAAVTSRVLRKGLSLTQIYTQLVDVTNELAMAREENEKLKAHMDDILHEIEEKTPILQQQREDYESALDNVNTLSNRLEELLIENNTLQEQTEEANKIANIHTRENQTLKTQLSDLARQVCFLLKEIQELRTGHTIHSNDISMESDDLTSSQIISKKLVTFRDIEELQQNNQKLLTIVKTLSARQEEFERVANESTCEEMKEKLDKYIEQFEEMRASQDRQAKMFDGLLKQRDMYKNMYQQGLTQAASRGYTNNQEKENDTSINEKSTDEITKTDNNDNSNQSQKENEKNNKEWERKLSDSETRLKQITDDFETYKKEKAAHEKMLGEEIDRLRKESESSSTKCCRLKAQLDSSNERFHLLQANVVSYKEQIKILEEKCNTYNTTIGKHEQSIMILKDECLSAQSKLSRAEVQLENLRQERQILKDSENRLLKEREVLHRERQTQALLKADVESIKASLERSQVEGQLRAEQRLDDITRECAALRRRLQEEQDRFRELTSHLEKRVNNAENRLTEERALAERVKSELDQARLNETENLKRIDELNNKNRQLAVDSITKPITGNDNKKIKDLELQLTNSQTETKSLQEQLKSARNQNQQYCDIAESSEAQLREITAQHNREKEELENMLKNSRNELSTLENKLRVMQEELSKISSGNQETDFDLREKLAVAEKKLEELDEVKGELELVKSDLQSATLAAKEAEEKYVREMCLHSTDLQCLAKLKEESQDITGKISTLTQERNSAIENLELEKSTWKEREQRVIDEMKQVQKQVEDLNAQNAILHSQIQELSDRAAVMQSQQTKFGGNESADTSFDLNRSFGNIEEDSKSHEQLIQLIKLMQKEKALNAARYDVLKAETITLKSQAEVAERRLKETEALLNSEREKLEIDVVTATKHANLLRKVETLNAITDSNRVLREERDILSTKVSELTIQVNALSEEVVPLREKARDLEGKTENLLQENVSLKGEATRWRQRANTLVERANKASPEDWRRLQTERENLSKLLTSERETHAKMSDEFNALKIEKSKLDEQVDQLQKQLHSQSEQLVKLSEDARKLTQELGEATLDLNNKEKELTTLKKELADKETVLNDIRNKELQIRKIARKYKMQYEELVKANQEEKTKAEEQRIATTNAANEEMQANHERDTQLIQELRERIDQLTAQFEELTRQSTAYQSESENLKKEIDVINRSCSEKEERAKLVLKNARTKIMQLTEFKKNYEKEIGELKTRVDLVSNDNNTAAELDARLNTMRIQNEARISRLEHEKSEILAEKEALEKKITLLQRQLAGVSGTSGATTEPPTANIKPMSARAETPFASIRPMSVVVQSRTAAVLPTTASAPVLVAPQQQQQQPQQQAVHTTETSSPTSSHTDYQPASTSTSSSSSSSSQSAPNSLRQLAVQPQLSGTAESTQREEPESLEIMTGQQQQCQQQQQQQQQTVALVSPRVEQQQINQVTIEQQQSVASSSTQSVSTSQGSTGHKRPRTLDSSASGSGVVEGVDHRPEQNPSPKAKRSRQQEVTPSATASASEIEYQVPTSSQRDQDEEGEDGCVVVVDCDEGEGGGNHQAQEEEEFENDPYEEMEEEEELPYGVEVEGEGDNNEVEIIMEEDTAGVEVPRQVQPAIAASQQQQQSEAISSAGPSGEPPSFARSARGIAPMPRQQQQQHLLLPQQGYEDGGDDCIVPSTPTLFVPRRGDGFGEAVSSPQVPQGRFTFGDQSAPTTASSTPSLTTSSGTAARTIFGSSAPGVAQVVQEGMDDTRMDLTQLEDGGTGRSVPTTPLQVSPAADMPPSTSSEPSEEQEAPVSMILERTPAAVDSNEDTSIPSNRLVTEEQDRTQPEIIADSDNVAPMENIGSEAEKQNEEAGASGSGVGEDDNVDAGVDASEEAGLEIVEDDSKEENREAEASPSVNTRQRALLAAAALAAAGSSSVPVRGGTARRAARTPFRTNRGARPTPIIWDNSQSNRAYGFGGPSGINCHFKTN
ncbi:nucleoprotein TPR-like isoform X2 [Leptopilina boulardi]|uniref:nucleoprotein TPR-like isoform X2 n=1 Tax=Leptopilina boulardi TaxID=63433 RepID=UPI0021F5236A|nr:nucleoprotein TPR-like isoform X2 [Leptopilina boulardi]